MLGFYVQQIKVAVLELKRSLEKHPTASTDEAFTARQQNRQHRGEKPTGILSLDVQLKSSSSSEEAPRP